MEWAVTCVVQELRLSGSSKESRASTCVFARMHAKHATNNLALQQAGKHAGQPKTIAP